MATDVSSPAVPGDHELMSKDRHHVPNTDLDPQPLDAPDGRDSVNATPIRRPASTIPRNSAQQGLSKSPSATGSPNAGLDPLSTQIFLRTTSGTEPTIAQRLRSAGRPDSPTPEGADRQSQDLASLSVRPSNGPSDGGKERKKGLLSRLSLRTPFKKDDDAHDSDSEFGDSRTDGSSAQALTSVVGAGGGYLPLHKEPPRYIRVKAHNKKHRAFNHVFLAQELVSAKRLPEDESHRRTPATVVGSRILKGGDAIWAAEFSIDGRYLAVAGKDQVVRVFSVLSTPEERKSCEEDQDEDANESRTKSERLSAPVFRSKATREFEGHTGEVLALSWSKNNFLLSSSMDKTVRLWHMSRQDCLCTFKHDDLVTSIAFHPTDDRFFLAGSLDAQLRLWSIPDKTVAFSAPTGDFVTAVAFTPDGKTAICGLLSGLCIFFETDGLKNSFQIHVRSSRGKNAKGSKITGIRTTAITNGRSQGDVKVLISSNDSRVRIYSLKTRLLETKFKGHENQSSQIHASFSDDGSYITSGSEDRKAYIWSLDDAQADLKDKQPYESFDAHPEVVTTSLIAPTATKQLLSASGDPIYDLCNPPPVTLLSLDEATASQSALSDQSDVPSTTRRPRESPAYVERSKHRTGNIIVTTDRMGVIKVFRQDCAYLKRQQSLWETGSKFSGKVTSGIGRSSSILTKTSAGSRVASRRGSLNMAVNPVQAQVASDRIMSWRQDIEGGRSSTTTSTRGERSVSPMKSSRSPLNLSASNLASEARRQPYIPSPKGRPKSALNPSGPTTAANLERLQVQNKKNKNRAEQSPSIPPTPSFSLISAPDSDNQEDKGDGSFWNLSRWRGSISGRRGTAGSGGGGGGGGNTGTDKHAHRRSMGVNDLRRLIASDDANRRRSMGPDFSSQASQADSEAVSLAESHEKTPAQPLVVGKRRTESPGKRRTDSGVAQLSGASSEVSNEKVQPQ